MKDTVNNITGEDEVEDYRFSAQKRNRPKEEKNEKSTSIHKLIKGEAEVEVKLEDDQTTQHDMLVRELQQYDEAQRETRARDIVKANHERVRKELIKAMIREELKADIQFMKFASKFGISVEDIRKELKRLDGGPTEELTLEKSNTTKEQKLPKLQGQKNQATVDEALHQDAVAIIMNNSEPYYRYVFEEARKRLLEEAILKTKLETDISFVKSALKFDVTKDDIRAYLKLLDTGPYKNKFEARNFDVIDYIQEHQEEANKQIYDELKLIGEFNNSEFPT